MLRATPATAVVEAAAAPPPGPPAQLAAAAAGLTAPWRWAADAHSSPTTAAAGSGSGATGQDGEAASALLGDAVYGGVGLSLSADDVASSALNLALVSSGLTGVHAWLNVASVEGWGMI